VTKPPREVAKVKKGNEGKTSRERGSHTQCVYTVARRRQREKQTNKEAKKECRQCPAMKGGGCGGLGKGFSKTLGRERKKLRKLFVGSLLETSTP